MRSVCERVCEKLACFCVDEQNCMNLRLTIILLLNRTSQSGQETALPDKCEEHGEEGCLFQEEGGGNRAKED